MPTSAGAAPEIIHTDYIKMRDDIAGKKVKFTSGAGADRFTDVFTLRAQLIAELETSSSSLLRPTQVEALQRKLDFMRSVDTHLQVMLDYRASDPAFADEEEIINSAQDAVKALYTQIKDSEEEVVLALPALDNFIELFSRAQRNSTLKYNFSAHYTSKQQTDILKSWTKAAPCEAQEFLSRARKTTITDYRLSYGFRGYGDYAWREEYTPKHALVINSLSRYFQATPEVFAILLDTSSHKNMIIQLKTLLSKITNPAVASLITKYKAIIAKLELQLAEIRDEKSATEFKFKLIELSALMTDSALQNLMALPPTLDLEREDEVFMTDLPNILKFIKAYNDRIKRLDALRRKTFADHPVAAAILAKRTEVLNLVELYANRSGRLELLDILAGSATFDKLTEVDTKLAEVLTLLPAGIRVEFEAEADLDTFLAKVRELHTLALPIKTKRSEVQALITQRRDHKFPANAKLTRMMPAIQAKRKEALADIERRLAQADLATASAIEAELVSLQHFDKNLSLVLPILYYDAVLTEADALTPELISQLRVYGTELSELRLQLYRLSNITFDLQISDDPKDRLHAPGFTTWRAHGAASEQLGWEVFLAQPSRAQLAAVKDRVSEFENLCYELRAIFYRESDRAKDATHLLVVAAPALAAITSSFNKVRTAEEITAEERAARAAFMAHYNDHRSLICQLRALRLKNFSNTMDAEIQAAREAILIKLLTTTYNTETAESYASIRAHITLLREVDADLELIFNYNPKKPIDGITPEGITEALNHIKARYQALAEKTPRVIEVNTIIRMLQLRSRSIELESTVAPVSADGLNSGGPATAGYHTIDAELDPLRTAKITPDTNLFSLFQSAKDHAGAPAAGAGVSATHRLG